MLCSSALISNEKARCGCARESNRFQTNADCRYGRIGNIGNHADIQAFVFDRRTGSQTADGLFEKCGVIQRAVVRQVGDFAAAVVKREAILTFNVFAVACFRRVKGNRAGQQGRQRGGVEFDTAACGFDIDAALQPETAGGINQFVGLGL